MARLPLKSIVAAAALFVCSVAPSVAQTFEYTPYKGYNNTGGQPTEPPPDSYTPLHQSAGFGSGPPYDSDSARSGDQGAPRQSGSSDAYNGGSAPAPAPGNAYAPAAGTYSPSEDVFSPARAGRGTPPAPSQPPRGVGGPPIRDFDGQLQRIEVQAAAPDDGIPLAVRERDARRAAIQGWRSKVADRYGPEFSQWRSAVGKHLDCHRDRQNGVICTATGQPARGFNRYGQGPRN